ncbi:MAG TPA: hypothetical protein VLL25_06455 [Acidimicrobiales bacterium]|nr:hypothetical protein [Acidimicrobiales bacterium]
MSEKEVVQKDEEELHRLDEEIAQARQHLKEELHQGEPSFIEEGREEDEGDTDDTIAPG